MSRCILVVEDNRDLANLLDLHLRDLSYDVDLAFEGDAGFEKLNAKDYDLIILDIIMPEQHGFKVCEALKSDPQLSKIPVIMLTSLSQQMGETAFSMTDGMMLEADDYVDKPVTPEELLRRVQKLLEQSQA